MLLVTAKEKLRERVEALSEEEAGVALRLVEQGLDDPVLRALASAPDDDEPWTEADEAALAEVEADRAAGVPTISHEEIKREFDIE
jgi:hypothetical protein